MARNLAKILSQGYRDKEKLVSAIGRHLLSRPIEEDAYAIRGRDSIHPSEMAKENWCHRATYYRIMGVPVTLVPLPMAWEMVFDRGEKAHQKWQNWCWEMKILRGLFYCKWCLLLWQDVSPFQCPRCEAARDLLTYAEVPLRSDEYMITGSADGDVFWDGRWQLIELKTVGAGTVRIEAPGLMKQYSYKHLDTTGQSHEGTDWYKLWQSIHYPFPSHLRQGMLYCLLAGRDEITYIYDPKFLTAMPKEFTIKFQRDPIEEALDKAQQVKAAVASGRPPKRPVWAEPTHKICQECPYLTTCWGVRAVIRFGEDDDDS